MTQEDKELLLKDLCGRLPYETLVQYEGKEWLITGYGHGRVSLLSSVFSSVGGPCPLVEEVKPYLRLTSSMTEEERKELAAITTFTVWTPKVYEWYLEHHFDIHKLIEKGLALEVLEGMYKTE